jgi:hypothetical protein
MVIGTAGVTLSRLSQARRSAWGLKGIQAATAVVSREDKTAAGRVRFGRRYIFTTIHELQLLILFAEDVIL